MKHSIKTIKDFFEKDYPDVVSYKWKCTDKNIVQAEKYPEFKNEILGEFFDNPGVSTQCIKCIIPEND